MSELSLMRNDDGYDKSTHAVDKDGSHRRGGELPRQFVQPHELAVEPQGKTRSDV